MGLALLTGTIHALKVSAWRLAIRYQNLAWPRRLRNRPVRCRSRAKKTAVRRMYRRWNDPTFTEG